MCLYTQFPMKMQVPLFHEMQMLSDLCLVPGVRVVGNNTVYCKYDRTNKIYAYHMPTLNWSSIPDCSNKVFAMIVIAGLLTTIGVYGGNGEKTDKLFGLTGEGSDRKWTEEFPPMPTKRYHIAALCTGAALIVAGGYYSDHQVLKIVEVLNTDTRQWLSAPDLPEPLSYSPLTLCGDLVYLLGGVNTDNVGTSSVYSCSLSSLLLSSDSKSLVGHFASTIRQSSQLSE